MITSASIAMTLLATVMLSNGHYYHGYGTAYSGPFRMDSTGQNMCEFNPASLNPRWQVYYAAINGQDWSSAGGGSIVCGRCVEVVGVKGQTAPGHHIKPVAVKIVDQCPACNPGDLDFSSPALSAITGYSWDRKMIKWKYVTCPTNPYIPITLRFKHHRNRGKK